MQKRAAKLPEQPLSFFYEKLVGCIFSGGMRVRTVDAHWRAIEKAFRGFDPVVVSTCTVQELLQVPDIIKHQGKLRGCILAAGFILETEREFGSFYSFLQRFGISSTPPVERWSIVCLLANRIPWIGTATACDFLKEVGLTAAMFWIMEERAADYWHHFRRRAIELKDLLGYRLYKNRPTRRLLTATNASRAIYGGVIVFWIIALIWHSIF